MLLVDYKEYMAVYLVGLLSEYGIQHVDFIPFAPDHVLDKVLCDEIVEIDDGSLIMAGSVDGGDVSYIAPFAQITAATWPEPFMTCCRTLL